MATPGKVGRVLTQTTDAAIAFTAEATTANVTYTRYTITASAKCYWDKNTDPTVYVDSVEVTTGYSIEYAGGVIIFDSALTSGNVVTVTGAYVVVEQLAGFFNWSLTVNNTTIDATTYEGGEWSEFELGTKNWTATAEKFWVFSEAFSDRIGQEVIVVLYCDFGTPKTRFEGYGVIDSTTANSTVNELVTNQISFTGSQGIYFRAA